MAMIDPEQERIRLADFYSRQLDGRLEKVAGEAYELSDLAREALRAELKKRGLEVELAQFIRPRIRTAAQPGDPPEEKSAELGDAALETPELQREIQVEGVATIRTFRDLPEALFAKGCLESAGIDCTLIDDNMVRLDWFISNLLGGIKLQVKAEDANAANQILSQPIPEHLDVAGVGDYVQPKCPHCGSLDINFQEVSPTAYLSTAVSVPIPFHRRAWRCHSCDVEWEDDGETEGAEK